MYRVLILLFMTLHVPFHSHVARGDEPIAIGQQRELLTDDHLIQEADGIVFRLHQPEPEEVVLVTDRPWEGNTCAYYTIFQDGDKYRMYYRGSHWTKKRKRQHTLKWFVMQRVKTESTGKNRNSESVSSMDQQPTTSFGMG